MLHEDAVERTLRQGRRSLAEAHLTPQHKTRWLNATRDMLLAIIDYEEVPQHVDFSLVFALWPSREHRTIFIKAADQGYLAVLAPPHGSYARDLKTLWSLYTHLAGIPEATVYRQDNKFVARIEPWCIMQAYEGAFPTKARALWAAKNMMRFLQQRVPERGV